MNLYAPWLTFSDTLRKNTYQKYSTSLMIITMGISIGSNLRIGYRSVSMKRLTTSLG